MKGLYNFTANNTLEIRGIHDLIDAHFYSEIIRLRCLTPELYYQSNRITLRTLAVALLEFNLKRELAIRLQRFYGSL